MTALPLLLLVFLVSYLVGAIPFGYLVGRMHGRDILNEGSRNIGATNVGRVLGARWGVLVFLLDFAKGAIPVALAGLLDPPTDLELPPRSLPVLAGVAAFIGHLLPIYLGFRGGKGVATGAGVVAVLMPVLTVIVLLGWGVVLWLTRYVSLASLFASALLLLLRLVTVEGPFSQEHLVVTLFALTGCLLIFVRHHGNIRRLLAGTENRL